MGILWSGGGGSSNKRMRIRSAGSKSSGVSVTSTILFGPPPPPPPPPAPPAPPQPKAPVLQAPLNLDQAPERSKKPAASIGAQQRVAKAGETVPIVFGKRASDNGGVWVSPSMSKTGVNNFVGVFLYPISQGQIVSSPEKHLAWNGTQCVAFRDDAANITLTHYYSTAAAMAATPNACPITSGKIFCDYNVFSFVYPDDTIDGINFRSAPIFSEFDTVYARTVRKTLGSGNLTNTVFETDAINYKITRADTGADVTADYWTAIGSGPSGFAFYINAIYNSSGVPIAGRAAGTVETFPSSGLNTIDLTTGFLAGVPLVTQIDNFNLETQINQSNPATDSTLVGERHEQFLSIYPDPANPPSSANYQSFGDITFLEINGDIYTPATDGSFPSSTAQLSIFYANGVSVDLFSQAKVSGQYQTGASNQFVDLALYLFKILKRVDGANTADIAAPVDTSNLITLAAFCTNNSTFFNGIIEQQVNAIEYLSKTAPFFLLRFISSNGRYSFQPILPITSGQQIDTTALTPAATFTDADILPGSFSKTYAEAEQRRGVTLSLLYRRVSNTEIGSDQTVSVRLSTTAVDAPIEQFDLSDCCTSAAHATLFGKYQLAFRKHVTHSVSFQIPLDTSGLIPTQIIKLQRSRVSSVGDNRTETEHYQIEKIMHSTDGVTTIEATHHPLTSGNISEIANEVVNGIFTVS